MYDKNANIDDWKNSFIALDLDRIIGPGASCLKFDSFLKITFSYICSNGSHTKRQNQ